jgi:hypothetical protein
MKPTRCSLLLLNGLAFLRANFVAAVDESSLRRNTSFNPLNALRQFPIDLYADSEANMSRVAPVIALSHGGGPMPLLGDPQHAAITKSLKTRVPKILKLGTPEQPRAIVLVTAHWSTTYPKVSSGEKPDLYYDYGGFPDEAYHLKYPAPGSPEVAELVKKVLEEEGLKGEKDGSRGTYLYPLPIKLGIFEAKEL